MKKTFLLLLFILQVSAVFAQYTIKRAFANYTFDRPSEMISSIDGSNRFFVLQQRGIIYVFKNDTNVNNKKIFMNLTNVSQAGYEGGLMGMAFHPNFSTNRYFYLHYTFDSVSKFWNRISRFTVSANNPDTALRSSERIIMTIAQPYVGHKGGRIQFGSDEFLYIALGDGGNEGDPLGNGQNKSTLLGKILRINIKSTSPGKDYSIPASNPFYGNTSGYKEEIYAYGFRNPWKFSFDFHTGRLWAGDVGQYTWEEVDIVEKGKNYGWNKMEGFHCFGTCDTTGKGFTRPVWEFYREPEHAVIGGYVYRGLSFPDLYGKYIYGDLRGYVYALTYNGTTVTNNQQIHDYWGWFISSFGVGEDNEIYILKYYDGAIFRLVNKTAVKVNLKMVVQGMLNNNKLNMKDTVSVNLRNTTLPYGIVSSAKTVIDSLNFSGTLNFESANSGNYYLQITHRNSVETWSKILNLSNTSVNNFDLTLSQSQAYGNNLILKNGKYCIYSGDISRNGTVGADDLTAVDNGSVNFQTGYLLSDLNGDKFVDAFDLAIVGDNSYHFVTVIRP